MPTFGVKAEITLSTDKSRQVFGNFYKGFSKDTITMKQPASIQGNESEIFDLSDSDFILLTADDYGLEQEALNIKFLNSASEELLIAGVGYLFMSCSNLVSMEVENTTSNAIEINLIY